MKEGNPVLVRRRGLLGYSLFPDRFMHFHPEEQSPLIECSPGTIVVTGPKAGEFCERFCGHKVSVIKADGSDITALTMVLNGRKEVQP